jgi:DNA processing protein
MDLLLPDVAELTSVYALESIKGFGPQKFRDLRLAGLSPADVLEDPQRLPISGKRGDTFRSEIDQLVADGSLNSLEQRALRQIERAQEESASMVLYSNDQYPPILRDSNNPVPVLYIRGDISLLHRPRAVACVGSRDIQDPYASRQSGFASNAAQQDWLIVSGFALGADSVAHRAAQTAGGATVCVMPCGLDRPFPPENKELWKKFTQYSGAVMLSEFSFGTPAATLTLRKRNKTIVGLALGVLIGQSSSKGGAMNAYRFGKEQHKPIATFAPDGAEATSGNEEILQSHGTVFPADHDDAGVWDRWLQSL